MAGHMKPALVTAATDIAWLEVTSAIISPNPQSATVSEERKLPGY